MLDGQARRHPLRILFGLDLILWYIRILHLFAAHERLGPKLIMIFNTVSEPRHDDRSDLTGLLSR
jgi:hypothetical protein